MTEYDLNEADTIREYITPAIMASGWTTQPYSITQEKTFTDGRILVQGKKFKRGPQKRADYILRYRRDTPVAVVEAKQYSLPASQGLEQAKEYAQILDLKFAYATNGREIIEYDFLTGKQTKLSAFPHPEELWARLTGSQQIDERAAKHILEPYNREDSKLPRYYQEIAINRAVQAISQGRRRSLLTMATGTGKTFVAFQICWKLWNSGWNKRGGHQKPRILFLADRNVLIDDPKDKTFSPFDHARFKIEGGNVVKSREMYFALYQSLAATENRPAVYKQFAPDFFDLIVIDECHRGSARDDSNWHEILEYFEPAYQLGMTATPRRDDNGDTYDYFGEPLYTYSLKQGIEDGFLAPYTVHRVVTDLDATGWRPEPGQRDRYGREIPDAEYTTQDFDRYVAIRLRTYAIAKHITDFLTKSGNRYAKTIIFCADQEHALEMRDELINLNSDLMRQNSDYVVRITADEGDRGIGHLDRFKDVETLTPVIVTTSKLLTTGVDIPTCRNVVIARVVNSMTEFKQIIGRGTRVRDDYGKLFFNILDYTGSATKNFADPEFDGVPTLITEERIDKAGETVAGEVVEDNRTQEEETDSQPEFGDEELVRRKYYVDDVPATIVAEMTYELDQDGRRIMTKFTDYAAAQVRTLYPNSADMRRDWCDPQGRANLIAKLEERNIDFDHLAAVMNQPDADAFDLLCNVAFNAPIRTRRERAERVQTEETKFFKRYAEPAQQILVALLEKYAELGLTQFKMPDVFKVQPLTQYGNISEIARLFGGADKLRLAVTELQNLLYAA
jgi:type I restriction enzyme R subunit